LFAALALLVLAGTSPAQYRGYRARVAARRSVYPPNRMPGWDWWRIYPWSPYNYGRNPYNPIVYPYVAPYPVYTPYAYGAPTAPSPEQPTFGAADSPQPVLVPHPTGGFTIPPRDAAVIRLYIPDEFGQVYFDDVKTSSIGTTRYYVTPSLPGDKSRSYVVKATFRRGDRNVTEERAVLVSPGKTAVVDFTKAQAAAE
jgi:uncharacterized protein (TIGR03000 family)